jgi:Protein of unknown function (DUF5672)
LDPENLIVCVLIIIHKEQPSEFEKISILQCAKILNKRDIYFICPQGFNEEIYKSLAPTAIFHKVEPKWQRNYNMFNRMKILPILYERFRRYKYILFYEPDAFVFRDELDYWCSLDMDYWGAPWFENFAKKEGEGEFLGVGNGGFSLRKVQSHLEVLNSFKWLISPAENWKFRMQTKPRGLRWARQFGGFLLDYLYRNNSFKWLNSYQGHEDQFWGLSVSHKFKWFKVPDYKMAAAFAFEMQPHRLFALNSNHLPFGCHAWWKYDLPFWKPFIEGFGYNLEILFNNSATR